MHNTLYALLWHVFPITAPTVGCVQIMRIIKAIRHGWIKPHPGAHRPRVYMLWDEVDQVGGRGREGRHVL